MFGLTSPVNAFARLANALNGMAEKVRSIQINETRKPTRKLSTTEHTPGIKIPMRIPGQNRKCNRVDRPDR